MNRQEEILHQQISEAWNNTHKLTDDSRFEFQRLICQWTNSETGQSGNKARSMGVKKGIADWQWMRESGKSCWIELKTETGTQSKDQKDFEALCNYLGHEYHICRSYDDFWSICGIETPIAIELLRTR